MCANYLKRLSLLLLVLVLVLCSASAFSFTRKTKVVEVPETPAEPQVLVVTAEEVVAPPTQLVYQESLPSQNEDLIELSTTLENLENQNKLNKNEIESIVSDLKIVRDGVDIMKADIKEKQTIIDELSIVNAQQADDIAYLQGRYDKETKASKFFANAGGVIGFADDSLLWGVTGNIGIKIGKGLLISTGASYMIGTFYEGLLPPSLNNLSVNATVGWEW